MQSKTSTNPSCLFLQIKSFKSNTICVFHRLQKLHFFYYLLPLLQKLHNSSTFTTPVTDENLHCKSHISTQYNTKITDVSGHTVWHIQNSDSKMSTTWLEANISGTDWPARQQHQHEADSTKNIMLTLVTPTQQQLTPSLPAIPNFCCSKVSSPYWSNSLFLIFDIRAWHSVLSARVRNKKLKSDLDVTEHFEI